MWNQNMVVEELSTVAQSVKNLTCSGLGLCGGVALMPAPVQWVKGSGVSKAAAQIQSLAWELPYVMDVAIKLKRKNKKEHSNGIVIIQT